MAIGTSVADTTSNGCRALDFPVVPIAFGNSCFMEPARPTTPAEPVMSVVSHSHMCTSVLSTQIHTGDETSERGWQLQRFGRVMVELGFRVSQFLPRSQFSLIHFSSL